MKKSMVAFMAVFIAFFLAIGTFITAMVIGQSRVSLFLRDSDDHLRDVVVNGTRVYARHTDEDAPRTSLHQANVSYFMDAVNRSGLLFIIFPPSDRNGIVVTFADGAEYTVVDGGKNSDGKDVAYIFYKYKDEDYCYRLIGFDTYKRVSDCVSPEGFGYPNWIVGENGEIIDSDTSSE